MKKQRGGGTTCRPLSIGGLMKTETWKDIPDYEGRYQISDTGRIYGICHNRILTPKKCGSGYQGITLCKGGAKSRFYIHRLVAVCFLPEPDSSEYEINHKDLNKTNNHASNLEWVTRTDNFEHAYQHGRVNYQRPKRRDNKTGKPGVCRHSGGYQVTINHQKKHIYLGWYKELTDAVNARNYAERRIREYEND